MKEWWGRVGKWGGGQGGGWAGWVGWWAGIGLLQLAFIQCERVYVTEE